MKLKIISDSENKTFGRKDIAFSIQQEGATSQRSDVHTELCKKLNLNPESTIIVSMQQHFGAKESSAIAHSYETKELMERHEPRYLLKRIYGKDAKGASSGAEQPAAAQK